MKKDQKHISGDIKPPADKNDDEINVLDSKELIN